MMQKEVEFMANWNTGHNHFPADTGVQCGRVTALSAGAKLTVDEDGNAVIRAMTLDENGNATI